MARGFTGCSSALSTYPLSRYSPLAKMFSPKNPDLVPPTLRCRAPYCSRDILSPLRILLALARRPRSASMSSSKFTALSALNTNRLRPPFSFASNCFLLRSRCFLMRAYASVMDS